MTKPSGFVHTRINGKLRALHSDGRVTPPIICGGDEGEDDKKFSQADVNRMIQERLARAESKLPADYEELQAAKKRLDEIEAAGATDLENANKRITALETENGDLKTKVGSFEAAERTRNVRTQIVKAAKASTDPEAVADLLLANNAVAIDDAGQVTDAETAVKQLLEDKPYLASGTGSVDNGQGRNRGGGEGKPSGLAAGRASYEARHGSK